MALVAGKKALTSIPVPASTGRTLVVCGDDAGPGSGQVVDHLSWADAQQQGHRRLHRYSRILCLPTAFPEGADAEGRLDICRALRRRLEGGALVVFVIPRSKLPAVHPDKDWNRTQYVVQETTGTRFERVEATYPLVHEVAADCPNAIAGFLRPLGAGFRLDVTGGALPLPIAHDDTQVLSAFEDFTLEPAATAGFVRSGGWLIVPAAGDAAESADLEPLLALFDELQGLCRAHGKEQARRAAEPQRSLDAVPLPAPAPPRAPKPRGRRPATSIARPGLPDGKLFVIPIDGVKGFLQLSSPGQRPITTAPLHRGAWIVATVIFNGRNFDAGPGSDIELEELREALTAADIPSGERSSIRSYVTQLRRGLEQVLGRKLPPRAIHMPRGGESLRIRGLRSALPGGAELLSIRKW